LLLLWTPHCCHEQQGLLQLVMVQDQPASPAQSVRQLQEKQWLQQQ
jgi:hypothetical protein